MMRLLLCGVVLGCVFVLLLAVSVGLCNGTERKRWNGTGVRVRKLTVVWGILYLLRRNIDCYVRNAKGYRGIVLNQIPQTGQPDIA